MEGTPGKMAAFRRENIRRGPNSSHHPPITATSNSDTQSRSSNQVGVLKEPVEMPCDSNAKISQDWWWLHLQTELGNCGELPCQTFQTSNAIHESVSDESVDNLHLREVPNAVKGSGDSYVNVNASTAPQKLFVDHPASMKYDRDFQMLGVEAILNCDSHKRPEKKDPAGMFFPDCEYRELEIADSFLSDNDKSLASDLKSHQVGFGKVEPWWHATGKDDLATMVAQKSLKHLENCDLPQPLTKFFRTDPITCAKVVIHDGTFMNEENRSMSLTRDSDKKMSQKIGTNLSHQRDHFPSEDNIKAELLGALRHSQTRAREAEKAAEQALKEKEHVTTLFFRQASQLFAYRQWFFLLQLENLCVQLGLGNQPKFTFLPALSAQCKRQAKEKLGKGRKRKNGNQGNGSNRFYFAFAVGLGLAGAGLFLGWTLGFLLPPI